MKHQPRFRRDQVEACKFCQAIVFMDQSSGDIERKGDLGLTMLHHIKHAHPEAVGLPKRVDPTVEYWKEINLRARQANYKQLFEQQLWARRN